MADLFDFSRCPPEKRPASPPKIDSYVVIQDCAVPDAPPPIYQCPRPTLSPPGPVGPPGADVFTGRFAVTDSAGLSAFNPTTKVLGVGFAMLEHADPDTGALVDDLTVQVFTDSPDGVPGNTRIQLKYIEGLPVADVVAC